MKYSNLDIKKLVQVSLEELNAVDAIPAEAHTPELVEESNESIDEAVHAHGEIETHAGNFEALENVVEELHEVVEALESADGLGVVSQENAEESAEVPAPAAAATEGSAEVVVAAPGGDVAEGVTVAATDTGIVMDPAVVEPQPEQSIVSLERFHANIRRLDTVYKSVGMESLPTVVPPEKKTGVVAGAKARIQAIIKAMKAAWDRLVAAVKEFLEQFTNAAGVTQKRAAALVSKANAAHGHTAEGTVKTYDAAELKKAMAEAAAKVKAGFNYVETSASVSLSGLARKDQAPWSLDEIKSLASEAETICAAVVSAKAEIETNGKALDAEFDKAYSAGDLSPKLKADFKAKRQALSQFNTNCKETIKLVKIALGSAEKSLRAYKAPAAAAATA